MKTSEPCVKWLVVATEKHVARRLVYLMRGIGIAIFPRIFRKTLVELVPQNLPDEIATSGSRVRCTQIVFASITSSSVLQKMIFQGDGCRWLEIEGNRGLPVGSEVGQQTISPDRGRRWLAQWRCGPRATTTNLMAMTG
jgi:hypothetical protein